MKSYFFPDEMTRLEKMLRRSIMEGYELAVDRKSEAEIVLTVYDGGESIAVQIYKDIVKELEMVNGSRVFFAHAINRNSKDVFYLTRTRIEADPDLKRIRRLEASVCDQIVNQDGKVRYDGVEPVYECAVPLQKIVCLAAEPPT